MKNHPKVLAIIPARGGSKGVKNKNIRTVAGKPLIWFSINEAKKSKNITKLVVSTDDNKIKQISESYGAQVMLRPKKYADDKTSMTDTIKFVYKKIQEKGASFDFIILLQPTAPFRLCSHIDKAIEEFTTFENGKSMVSVYKVDDCHPSRMYRIEKNHLKKVMNEPEGSLRQDLEHIYHRNGAIYIFTANLLMEEGRLLCDNPIPFIMSKSQSVNIDDETDLEIANYLLSKKS